MSKIINGFNKLLWFFLFLNPFLDIISGSYVYMKYPDQVKLYDIDIGITPSLVVRMCMLIIFVLYILIIRDKKSVLAALPLGLVFVLSVMSEYLSAGAVNLKADIQYFAKFCYNIAILFVYGNYFRKCGFGKEVVLERIYKMLCIVSLILSAGIIVPYFLDFGFYTYADRFGYRGFRGVYFSGNDITAAFMLVTPVTLCKFLSLSENKHSKKTILFYGSGPVLASLSLLVLGTKTAYMSVFITLAFTLGYGIFHKVHNKEDRTLRYFLYFLAGVVAAMIVISLLSMRSIFTVILSSFLGFGDAAKESTKTLLLSGRQNLFAVALEEYKNGGIITWLFGLGRGSQEKVIEMDVFEIIFYYGLFGAVCMSWHYIKYGVSLLLRFLRNVNLASLGVIISVGTCVIYLAIAGHVLFSVTSGFFFSFMLTYGDYLMQDYESDIKLRCCKLRKKGTGR